MPKPSLSPDFAVQLAAYVEALPRGVTQAAELCGVNRRTIHLWLKDQATPNLATRVGVIGLLAMAVPKRPRKPSA